MGELGWLSELSPTMPGGVAPQLGVA